MSEDSGCASRGACEAMNSPLLGEDFASRVCISALHDFIRVVIIVPVEPYSGKLQNVKESISSPKREHILKKEEKQNFTLSKIDRKSSVRDVVIGDVNSNLASLMNSLSTMFRCA